jgi:hypothetical protein
MAEVQLSLLEAEGEGRLPPVCMECGAPATTVCATPFTTVEGGLPPPPPPPPENPIGCLLGMILLPMGIAHMFSKPKSRKVSVRVPLCDRHSSGWPKRASVQVRSISEETIVLSGVSEQFVSALRQRRATGVTQPQVKVRCRQCQTLNEETARFCNQCGATM